MISPQPIYSRFSHFQPLIVRLAGLRPTGPPAASGGRKADSGQPVDQSNLPCFWTRPYFLVNRLEAPPLRKMMLPPQVQSTSDGKASTCKGTPVAAPNTHRSSPDSISFNFFHTIFFSKASPPFKMLQKFLTILPLTPELLQGVLHARSQHKSPVRVLLCAAKLYLFLPSSRL